MTTVYSTIKTFCTTQENAPAKALNLVLASTDHMIQHRDWDGLAYFLGHAPSSYRGIAKRIVGAVLGGVKYDSTSKVAKAHKCKGTFKMGDNFGPTDRIAELRALVANGEKITGKAVKEAFPPFGDEKTDAEIFAATLKSVLKQLDNKDISVAVFVAAMTQPEVSF
jgi:hypothetical protein